MNSVMGFLEGVWIAFGMVLVFGSLFLLVSAGTRGDRRATMSGVRMLLTGATMVAMGMVL